MDGRTRLIAVGCALVALLCAPVAAGSGSSITYIGQMASSHGFLDGVAAPQGTTVFPNSLVSTKDHAATVHLKNGVVVEVAANSSAFFEMTTPEQVQVAVRSGSVQYGTGTGGFASAASPTRLVIAQQQSGQPILSNTAVVCVLLDPAPAGSTVLRVNDSGNIDRDGRLLIKSQDGSKYEVHYVTRIQANYVYLDTPLKSAYSPQDVLIQGCECDRALGLPEDGLVGNLKEEAAAKVTILKYTPIVPLDPKAKLLVKRQDGSIKEIHSIKSFDGTDTITLGEKLQNNFEPGDYLIQGCHVPPVFAGFPFFKTLLLGAAAGAAGSTVIVSVIEECEECSPSRP